MSTKNKFITAIKEGYAFEGESVLIGGAMIDGRCQHETFVRLPLKTLNRHGLIAGATGTGKTKTLQIIAEQLSAHGVPSLLMDIKGDLSGIAAASDGHPKIDERHDMIGFPFVAGDSPIEFLSLSDEAGARLRATVSEFGPVLLAKILGLNDTQEGIPTPLVHVLLRAPQSRMDILSKSEIDGIIGKSRLIRKYNEVIDRESAYEILSAKIEDFQDNAHQEKMRRGRREKSVFEQVMNSTTTRQIGRTVARELTRGLLGVLGVPTTRRRRRRKSIPWL